MIDFFSVAFPPTSDRICTEKLFITQLKSLTDKFEGCTDAVVIDTCWADIFNMWGACKVQMLLDEALKRLHDKHKTLIISSCQHVQVHHIDWHEVQVFTPHSVCGDGFLPMPHHAIVYGDYSLRMDERPIDINFVGCINTHWTRLLAVKSIIKSSLISEVSLTDHWHFNDFNSEAVGERENNYRRILSSSKFTLCPRGTGPGSIRFWEALASGSIPILISDSIKLPEILDPFVFRIYEANASQVAENIIFLLSNLVELEKRRKLLLTLYYRYFSNSRLSFQAVNYLRSSIF